MNGVDDLAHNQADDLSRQAETGRDRSEPAGYDYLSIREALDLFAARGRAVTERTLQRYCEKRHLDGQKRITAEGEKWFVRRSSVERRLAELDDFDRLKLSRQAATGRDSSEAVGPENPGFAESDSPRQAPTPVDRPQLSHSTADDSSRQAATGRDRGGAHETAEPAAPRRFEAGERELYERLIAQLSERNSELSRDKEALRADKDVLLRQLEVKDVQIDRFFSSERDTKTLLGTLQNLMRSIWPQRSGGELGSRFVPESEALSSGLDRPETER